jgi:tol-pal system protein YbgF
MWQHTKGGLRLPFAVFGLGALAALAGGCANGAVEALQQDVAQLRQDLNGVTLAMHRNRGDTDTAVAQLDRRTRAESAETTRQLTALAARIDSLAAELNRVSARVEETSGRIEALQRQLAARPTAAPPASAQAPPAITPAPSTGPGPGADQAYQAAYLDFTKGNYPLAVSGFREFVRRFPDSARADEAQYLIGESYFSLARASGQAGRADQATRELEQAVQEFRRVLLNYPRGAKVPTALYKEGLALIELKQPRLAEARLRYLIENFPQSEEAPLARERLSSIPGS